MKKENLNKKIARLSLNQVITQMITKLRKPALVKLPDTLTEARKLHAKLDREFGKMIAAKNKKAKARRLALA